MKEKKMMGTLKIVICQSGVSEKSKVKKQKKTILDKCQLGCLINKRWFGIVSTLSTEESFESEKREKGGRIEPFTFAYTPPP